SETSAGCGNSRTLPPRPVGAAAPPRSTARREIPGLARGAAPGDHQVPSPDGSVGLSPDLARVFAGIRVRGPRWAPTAAPRNKLLQPRSLRAGFFAAAPVPAPVASPAGQPAPPPPPASRRPR